MRRLFDVDKTSNQHNELGHIPFAVPYFESTTLPSLMTSPSSLTSSPSSSARSHSSTAASFRSLSANNSSGKIGTKEKSKEIDNIFDMVDSNDYKYLSLRKLKSLDRRQEIRGMGRGNGSNNKRGSPTNSSSPIPTSSMSLAAVEKDLTFGLRNMERLAHIYFSQERYQEARNHYLDIIIKQPSCSVEVYQGMIQCCLELDNHDEAVWAAVQFESDYRHDVQSYCTHINVLMMIGRYREAIRACQHALKRFPNHEVILHLRGKCFYEQKDYRKAAGDFHKTIELTRAQRGQSCIAGKALQSWKVDSIF